MTLTFTVVELRLRAPVGDSDSTTIAGSFGSAPLEETSIISTSVCQMLILFVTM